MDPTPSPHGWLASLEHPRGQEERTDRREEPTGDDRDRLQAFFWTRPAKPAPSAGPTDAGNGSWPQHNFNVAAHAPRRPLRPPGRLDHITSESALWEVHHLLREPGPGRAADQPAPSPRPWPLPGRAREATATRTPTETTHPDAWLRSLEDPEAGSPTEARLIRTLRGDASAIRTPLIDVTDTLSTTPRHQGRGAQHGPRTVTTLPQNGNDPPGALRRLRGLAMKAAVVFLGVKVGVVAGYAIAAFL